MAEERRREASSQYMLIRFGGQGSNDVHIDNSRAFYTWTLTYLLQRPRNSLSRQYLHIHTYIFMCKYCLCVCAYVCIFHHPYHVCVKPFISWGSFFYDSFYTLDTFHMYFRILL
jgi:hypothetical protein